MVSATRRARKPGSPVSYKSFSPLERELGDGKEGKKGVREE